MVNRILKQKCAIIIIKVLSLIAFAVLLWSGFSATSSDNNFLIQLRNTNLGNLIVWSLWWPLIIVGAIFFGRVWCMVCPMELVTTLCAKIGLKLKPNKFVASKWVIVVFYTIVLLVGIQAYAIHRNPTYMAIYMLSIAIVSVFVGLLYKKNTFCKYVCPIGLLLGLYSKLSLFGLRTKKPSTCADCKDKSCIDKHYTYNINAKSCGVGLYPAKIDSNSNCILCGGCVRSCSKFQNKSSSIERPNPSYQRVPFAAELLSGKTLSWAEVAFLIMVSGFVISEVWTEWSTTKGILNSISAFAIEPLGFVNGRINSVLHGIVIFLFLPLLFWLVPYFIVKIMGSTLKIKEYLTHYSLSFIPIVAAAHFTKALLKSSSRFDYYNYLPSDINGMNVAQKILDGNISIAILPEWINIIITIITMCAIMVGIWLSFRIVSRINNRKFTDPKNCALYLISILYGALFLGMMLCWRIM